MTIIFNIFNSAIARKALFKKRNVTIFLRYID